MNDILWNENDDYQLELRRISDVPSSIIQYQSKDIFNIDETLGSAYGKNSKDKRIS